MGIGFRVPSFRGSLLTLTKSKGDHVVSVHGPLPPLPLPPLKGSAVWAL